MRRTISLLLLLTFLLVSATGVYMELRHGPKPTAMPTDSKMVSPAVGTGNARPTPSFFPKKLHVWAGYIMLVAGTAHAALNIRPLKNYLGFRRQA
jgi:hypothetical protein